MKRMQLGFAILLVFSSTIYAQEEISGITPANSIQVAGQKLNYNGAGLREKYFLDMYVGTLYLTNKENNPQAVIDKNESMAITLDIVSGLITSEKMISAIDEGFEKSTKGNVTPLSEKIKSFKAAFSEEIVKGDHFIIAYIKDQGVQIHKNGKQIKDIAGFEFKKALFGIWFCDDPADEDLKEGMLGLDD